MMTAVVQRGYGPPEHVLRVEHIDRPSVGDDDVLVRVKATSVNTPDWVTVTGVPNAVRDAGEGRRAGLDHQRRLAADGLGRAQLDGARLPGSATLNQSLRWSARSPRPPGGADVEGGQHA